MTVLSINILVFFPVQKEPCDLGRWYLSRTIVPLGFKEVMPIVLRYRLGRDVIKRWQNYQGVIYLCHTVLWPSSNRILRRAPFTLRIRRA